jgi:GMP synthase-like glutamine amidotransferase
MKNEIPKLEELVQFDTVLLSGSSYSVNSMAPQMQLFQEILLDALRINKKLKVLGICFGHQFIAKSNNI